MAIDFKCVKCNAWVSVPEAQAGQREVCPECGASVVVPRPIGGRLTERRLRVESSSKSPSGNQPRVEAPLSPNAAAPRRGRLIGAGRVAAAVEGLRRAFATWSQRGMRPKAPRSYVGRAVGITSGAIFLVEAVLAVMVVALPEKRALNAPLFIGVAIALPLVAALIAGVVASVAHHRLIANFEALESAALELGLTYMGDHAVSAAPWHLILPWLHNERSVGAKASATSLIVGGTLLGVDVFVVRSRQTIDALVRKKGMEQAVASAAASRRKRWETRWVAATIVIGVPLDLPDLLVLPTQDIEQGYHEQEIPTLRQVLTHDLPGHWVATSDHDWGCQLCERLAPLMRHLPQFSLQLIGGQLVLWRDAWSPWRGPCAKSVSEWSADIQMAVGLRAALAQATTQVDAVQRQVDQD